MNIDKLKQEIQNPINVYYYDKIDSTNIKIKEFINEKNDVIVIAKEQSDGRGTKGRRFLSPKDSGLYMSILIDAHENINDNLSITPMVAVAINLAIYDSCNIKTKIKWLNDIYLRESKVGGILCEMYKNKLIIGIGINTSYNKEFDTIMDKNIGFLFEKESIDIKLDLAINIYKNIKKLNYIKNKIYILEVYNENLYKKNEVVRILNKDKIIYGAILKYIDSDYKAVVSIDGIIKRLDLLNYRLE